MTKLILSSVPRVWPGETVVCIGTGPSLTPADVDACRGRARVIVINNAYKIAPWADVMYACDAKFWKWEQGAASFQGRKYAIEAAAAQWPGVEVLRNLGPRGLSLDPSGVKTGHNSMYQAINMAVLFGAATVLLLGCDMRGDHYFGSHPDKSRPPFAKCLEAFPTLVAPLKAIGVAVFNCSRESALTCFPRASLGEMLAVAA